MNRNLFLLAAALQLPVALWMQGCKDEDNSDDDTGSGSGSGSGSSSGSGEPSGTQPDQTKPTETLSRNKKPNETMQKLLDRKGKDVNFVVDDQYYSLDTTTVKSHIQIIDQVKTKKDKKTPGYHLIGYEHEEWFSKHFEYKPPAESRERSIREFAAVIFEEEFLEEETSPVVFDAREISRNSAIASVIIAQDITPKEYKKDTDSYTLITEVYANRGGDSYFVYPAGNAKNLLNILVPKTDVPDFGYDFAFEAAQHIFLFNSMMANKVDTKQAEWWKNVDVEVRTQQKQNIWMEIDEKKVQNAVPEYKLNQDVQAPFPGTSEHTIDSMNKAWKKMNDFAEELAAKFETSEHERFPLNVEPPQMRGFWNSEAEGKRTVLDPTGFTIEHDGQDIFLACGEPYPEGHSFAKKGAYEEWDLSKKDHKKAALAALFFDDKELQRKLQLFVEGWNHVFSKNQKIPEIKEPVKLVGDPKADPPTVADPTVEAQIAELDKKWTVVKSWNGEVVDAVEEEDFMWTEFTKFQPVITKYGKVLVLPTVVYDRIIGNEKFAFIPAKHQRWDMFVSEANAHRDSENKKVSDFDYVAPKIEDKPALKDYFVEEMVVHHPGFAADSDELTISYVLGIYDAWVEASDDRYRQYYNHFILGDHTRKNRRHNDRREQGIKRFLPDWDVKKFLPKILTFHTDTSQNVVDFEATIKARIEGKSVDVTVAAEAEKVPVKMAPASPHDSQVRSALQTDQ